MGRNLLTMTVGTGGQKKKDKKEERNKKTLSKSASEFTMTTQHRGGGQRASVCTDLSPGIGPIAMETQPYPSPPLLL